MIKLNAGDLRVSGVFVYNLFRLAMVKSLENDIYIFSIKPNNYKKLEIFLELLYDIYKILIK